MGFYSQYKRAEYYCSEQWDFSAERFTRAHPPSTNLGMFFGTVDSNDLRVVSQCHGHRAREHTTMGPSAYIVEERNDTTQGPRAGASEWI